MDRLEAYGPRGGSDKDAITHYLWNLALCESLFCMLQTLEVAFRNTLHRSIGNAISSENWLLNGPIFVGEREKEAIQKAINALLEQKKEVTEARMIAELSFGFWTSLADVRYDKVWPKFIKSAFPHALNSIRTRQEISSRVNKLRKLRNAVFHHHSIWHWKDLPQQHVDGFLIIQWIEPILAELVKSMDRFLIIHSKGVKAYSDQLPL